MRGVVGLVVVDHRLGSWIRRMRMIGGIWRGWRMSEFFVLGLVLGFTLTCAGMRSVRVVRE